tara:strand:+ start:273 stop:602 length:330 start_codon:yes stop_codon:yes gene_type:complete
MFKIKLYCNLLILFFKIFFQIWNYREFLNRNSRMGTAHIGHLGRMISTRVMNEKRGKTALSREDMIFYMIIESLKEKEVSNFKTELQLPISLLVLWCCEPIPEFKAEEE